MEHDEKASLEKLSIKSASFDDEFVFQETETCVDEENVFEREKKETKQKMGKKRFCNPTKEGHETSRIRSFLPTLPHNKQIGLHKHHRVPPFQPHHIQNRLNFAKETLSRGFLPELCLFDDEKTVRGRGPGKYFRSLREENTPRPESQSRAHPITLWIWGCVGVGFKSNIFIAEEKITGRIYTDAVINCITKAKMNPPLDTRVLLSDNADWHKKKDELPRIAMANINQKCLPALSSVLNPIEHIWAMLNSTLYANFARQVSTTSFSYMVTASLNVSLVREK
ncbi:hypothetical protein BLNAU_22196 [Blattamonas nauphoetae]|uniref:Tc1-like transposase DDE domain-containing protein n=1 Tax=Blattamonas nauphoetae TaxID=2049346 RepID=A0ABQ9WTS9_9EUKA|nr:hypothetical protein BLNAU_22196 [Blattamonas nauphoetae]